MFLLQESALAVGTVAGTDIYNTATANYVIAGNSASISSTATFRVDEKLDVNVIWQDAANIGVNTPDTDRVTTWLLTNTGNTTRGYLLTVNVQTPSIIMGNIRIFVDANTDGVPDPGELYTPGTNAGDLNPNGVIGTDDVMEVLVVADTPAGVDVVWADNSGSSSEGNRDGQHSDPATYTVLSASLAATKTIVSTTDEFGTGFAIPGADVLYLIRVTNSGAATVDANTVAVTDAIPADTQLCVATVSSCTAPSFTDGTSSSLAAATFEYSFISGATACDTTSFVGSAPTADANGYDAAVTCIRQQPTGSMNGSGGFFDVQITVGIQ